MVKNKRATLKKSFYFSEYFSIFIRYLLIILIAIPNMYLFYLIFTSLTVYSVYFLLALFYDATLSGVNILINELTIKIIDACVAGSAYYLLFMLNLSVPKISIKLRTKMIFYSFAILFLLNVFRIFFLSILAINGSVYFDFAHKLFWYVLSTVFVVVIWFWEVYHFKIKEIPLFSDLKFLYSKSAFKKVSKNRNIKM